MAYHQQIKPEPAVAPDQLEKAPSSRRAGTINSDSDISGCAALYYNI
jgi:hypothetical protein